MKNCVKQSLHTKNAQILSIWAYCHFMTKIGKIDLNNQIWAESAGLEPASPCGHLVSTEASYQLELTLQSKIPFCFISGMCCRRSLLKLLFQRRNKNLFLLLVSFSSQGRTRTFTPLRAGVFETPTSTNSATWPKIKIIHYKLAQIVSCYVPLCPGWLSGPSYIGLRIVISPHSSIAALNAH